MRAEERAREGRARRRSRRFSRVVAAVLGVGFAVGTYLTLGPDPYAYRFSPHPPATGPLHLLVLGDSLAAGVCGDGRGYVDLITGAIARSRPGSRFYNHAAPGNRIAGVRSQLASGPIRPIDGEIDAVIVQVGANDVQHLTFPPSFASDVRASLVRIHADYPRAAVVVLGVPDIAERARMVPAGFAPAYSTLTRLYDAIERRSAEQHGATFYDFFALSHEPAAIDPENVCMDGIHPTPAGYAVLAERLQPTLREALRY